MNMLERFKRLWLVWKAFGHRLVHLQNTILLMIVFIFGMLPSALFTRLRGMQLLDRRAPDDSASSYWTPVSTGDRDMDWAQRPY